MMLHIYPVKDEREHCLEGTGCECCPELEVIDGDIRIIHNAFDCRELVEQAELIKNCIEAEMQRKPSFVRWPDARMRG